MGEVMSRGMVGAEDQHITRAKNSGCFFLFVAVAVGKGEWGREGFQQTNNTSPLEE